MPKNLLRKALSIVLVTCVFSVNAQQLSTVYEQPRDPMLFETYREWHEGKLLEGLRASVLKRFNIENSLSLSIKNCGQANAFYRSESKEVVMCWELLALLLTSSERRFGKDRNTLITATTSLFTFVLYHELGHAVVDILKIATFGREEDNADQIAALMLLEDNKRRSHADSNISVLAVFDYWRTNDSPYLKKHQLPGPHSTSQQRAFNVVCWAIGSDPASRYKFLAQMTSFPLEQVTSCAKEFQRAESALNGLVKASTMPR